MVKYNEKFNKKFKEKDYERLYLTVEKKFKEYRTKAESEIRKLRATKEASSNDKASMSNIIEISKHINMHLKDEDLISTINDMILGVSGANYCAVYLINGDEITITDSNKNHYVCSIKENVYYDYIVNGEEFIINSKSEIVCRKNKPIHSSIGVPITLSDEIKGYIIIEHGLYDYFEVKQREFMKAIANHVCIALENNNLYHKVKENSIRDPLLGVYNRKHFFDTINEKITRKSNRNFAIVMIDIDDFKMVNDSYGHQFGDFVLTNTARIIQENVDKTDIVARYGGEEIIIYIKRTKDSKRVYDKVNNIRVEIEKNDFCCGCEKVSITASFGVSYYPEDSNELCELVSIADNRLYTAKDSGKNKVIDI